MIYGRDTSDIAFHFTPIILKPYLYIHLKSSYQSFILQIIFL